MVDGGSVPLFPLYSVSFTSLVTFFTFAVSLSLSLSSAPAVAISPEPSSHRRVLKTSDDVTPDPPGASRWCIALIHHATGLRMLLLGSRSRKPKRLLLPILLRQREFPPAFPSDPAYASAQTSSLPKGYLTPAAGPCPLELQLQPLAQPHRNRTWQLEGNAKRQMCRLQTSRRITRTPPRLLRPLLHRSSPRLSARLHRPVSKRDRRTRRPPLNRVRARKSNLPRRPHLPHPVQIPLLRRRLLPPSLRRVLVLASRRTIHRPLHPISKRTMSRLIRRRRRNLHPRRTTRLDGPRLFLCQ